MADESNTTRPNLINYNVADDKINFYHGNFFLGYGLYNARKFNYEVYLDIGNNPIAIVSNVAGVFDALRVAHAIDQGWNWYPHEQLFRKKVKQNVPT